MTALEPVNPKPLTKRIGLDPVRFAHLQRLRALLSTTPTSEAHLGSDTISLCRILGWGEGGEMYIVSVA
jgi:hypothetical protein